MMPINIHISGDTAEEVLDLMRGLTNPYAGVQVYRGSTEEESRKPNRPVSDEHVHEPAGYEDEGNAPTSSSDTSSSEALTSTSSGPELDSAGVPFDEAIHTGTKKKDGTWRMKKGAVAAETPAQETSEFADNAGEETASDADVSLPEDEAEASSEPEEDDEFAAFRQAEAALEETPAQVIERQWTDADMSALLAQAATKLGNADGLKKIIGKFVPIGAVVHSRHIPTDKREEFAQQVEEFAGIEFAG